MSETVQDPFTEPSEARVVIKKYANRRLYNTQTSSYVTLENLAENVRQGVDIVVFDARTGDDITRQVLTQIIFEAENSGQNLLPVPFLRQLIGLYGGQMQAMTPGYLEASLDAFVRQGERLRGQWRETIGGPLGAAAPNVAAPGVGSGSAPPGFSILEDQVRSNMALFDRAMKMFTPLAYRASDSRASSTPPSAASPSPDRDEALLELERRMAEMQRQIENLAARRE